MAESDKSPKPKVELGAAPEAAPARGRGNAGDAGDKDGAAKGPQPSGASSAGSAQAGFSRVSAWVGKTFPGHENAFWGGVFGLVAAVVLLAFGILKTLIVAVLVVAGIAVGQLVDGDPKLIRALQRLFSNNQ